jgi:hypothetical protein
MTLLAVLEEVDFIYIYIYKCILTIRVTTSSLCDLARPTGEKKKSGIILYIYTYCHLRYRYRCDYPALPRICPGVLR